MTAKLEKAAIKPSEVKARAVKQHLARHRAPFSLRCGAMLIDYTILISIVAFSTLIARLLGGATRTAGGSAETVGVFIAITAAVLDLGVLAGLTGRTIGKWATGLRMERAAGGELSIGRALLRHFVGYPLSFLTLGLGFVIAAVNSHGRALHDFIADTVVVREGHLMSPGR